MLVFLFVFVFNSCEIDLFKNSENKVDINYSKEFISDEKSAKKYADSIIKDEFNKKTNDYKIINVNRDADNNWVVHYMIDYNTLGGGITIVLSSETGKMIRIDFGE